MLEIEKAEYAGNYNIYLVFNDGRKGNANLEPAIFNDTRPIFARLRDQSAFADFKLAHSTVVWSDDLDIASEYLFFLAFKDDPDLQNTFRVWGYIS